MQIGTGAVLYALYAVFQMADVVGPRKLFGYTLTLIDSFRLPEPTRC